MTVNASGVVPVSPSATDASRDRQRRPRAEPGDLRVVVAGAARAVAVEVGRPVGVDVRGPHLHQVAVQRRVDEQVVQRLRLALEDVRVRRRGHVAPPGRPTGCAGPASYSGPSWSRRRRLASGRPGAGRRSGRRRTTIRACGVAASIAVTIAAPYAACSRRCPTRLSGPDEKWLLTAHSRNVLRRRPARPRRRTCATCGARV